MRKNIFIVALCLFASVANAQIRYGIEVGGVQSMIPLIGESAWGYKVGATIEIPLNEGNYFTSVETGLFFKNRTLDSFESYHKGANFDYLSFNLNYLELPIVLYFLSGDLSRERNIKASFGWGFVFNYGLSGNAQLTGIVGNGNKFDVDTNTPFKNSTIVAGDNSFDFQRFTSFNLGATMNGRIEFNRLALNLRMNLFYLQTNSAYIPRVRIPDSGISVSYRF